jgi:hypothetical protein
MVDLRISITKGLTTGCSNVKDRIEEDEATVVFTECYQMR